MLELVVLGFIGVALVCFWDRIRDWLYTKVADLVERLFGYETRSMFVRAVVVVDRVVYMGKRVVRKVAHVLVDKKAITNQSGGVKITEYESQSEYTLEELEEMDKKGQLIQSYASGGSE